MMCAGVTSLISMGCDSFDSRKRSNIGDLFANFELERNGGEP